MGLKSPAVAQEVTTLLFHSCFVQSATHSRVHVADVWLCVAATGC